MAATKEEKIKKRVLIEKLMNERFGPDETLWDDVYYNFVNSMSLSELKKALDYTDFNQEEQ